MVDRTFTAITIKQIYEKMFNESMKADAKIAELERFAINDSKSFILLIEP